MFAARAGKAPENNRFSIDSATEEITESVAGHVKKNEMSTNSLNTPITQIAVKEQFGVLKQDIQAISQKVGELEGEKEEHSLVLSSLKEMESDRTCFRLIGGVLVKSTVSQVAPVVLANKEGIESILVQLVATYKKKELELKEFCKVHDIKL